MDEESSTLDPQGAEPSEGPALSSEAVAEGVRVSWWESKLRALRARAESFQTSAAGRYWAHLSTADFMNSSFAFSALAVLSAFPFLAVTASALGGDIRNAIVARMGLNARAAHDVDALIATGNQAVAALTWVSATILVLGGIGMASTLSAWYHRIYERTPPRGVLRHFAYWAAGVAFAPLYIRFLVWLVDTVRPVGGRGMIFAVSFVCSALYWWWSSYMLLYRKVPLRQMLPAGVATAACITGLAVVSSLLFSDQITSGQKSYGAAGVVIGLVTFLVGFGVCLHAGAVFGRMWNERQAERASHDDGVP
jgi:uncharacterized BrkB/YihY/UPF0761 family membrane protein